VLGNWVKTFHPRNFGDFRTLMNSCKRAGKIQIKVFAFLIFKEFANPLIMGETIAEGPRIHRSVSCFETRKNSEVVADLGNFSDGNFEDLCKFGEVRHW
jgi:hypothetical protein